MTAVIDRLAEAVQGIDLRIFFARQALTSSVRLRLYRKLSSLARTGMPLPRALEVLWRLASDHGNKPDRSLAVVIEAWREQVFDGRPFGQAISGWVPERESVIVEAGTQDLAQSLDDAAMLIEESRKMMGAVFSAVTYPSFLFFLVGILLYIFSTEAIPAFAAVKPSDQWRGLAGVMATVAGAVRVGAVPVLVVVGLLLVAALWSLPRWTGEVRKRFDSLPPWSFFRLMTGASFLIALVAFLRAGVPVPEALRRLRAIGNPWLRERIDAALFYVNSGYHLGDALFNAGHNFPDREIVEDLRIYAAIGSFDEALSRLAQEWVRESITLLDSVGNSLKVVGMVLVAATIALFQAGMFSIQHQLSSGF
jgi:type II secretory pathway component PulF